MQKQKDYLCLPANQTHITVGFSSEHTAIDFGWLVASNSKNQDLVAVSDCEVIQTTHYNDGGYTSVIAWEDADNTWFAEYMHNLKDSAVKVGTILKQGQKVAKMGNTGTSRGEHVHFVLIKAPKGSKYSNAGMRKYRVDPAKYLYVFPNQTLKVGSLPKKPTKPYLNDIEQVAKDVINGKYGNGADRIARLKNAGYDHVEVQAKVNELLKGKEPAKPSKRPNEEIAREVIKGKWGNGVERIERLKAAGYDYNAIQKIVNKLL